MIQIKRNGLTLVMFYLCRFHHYTHNITRPLLGGIFCVSPKNPQTQSNKTQSVRAATAWDISNSVYFNFIGNMLYTLFKRTSYSWVETEYS